MIPRTSRTGALRAAPAACAAAPSLLALTLLVGAFLAVLWLLAAPAQADTAGSGKLGAPVAETASAAGGALGLGEAPALEKQTLERVVPEEVAEPVTATLGTVHQHLEKGTADTAAVAATLHEPAAGVRDEVRDEVRGVVTEIDRTRGETVERGVVHALPVTEPRTTRTTGPPEDEDTAETGEAERDSSSASPEGSAEAASPTAPGAPVRQGASAQHHHTASAAQATRAATTGTGAADRAPEHQRLQAAAGSAAPAAGAPAPAGGVAGYLTAAPLPAPAADTVRLAAHRLHTVPADPADDPTVSPD